MAVGKEIGVFDMQSTSVTLVPGKGILTTTHVNYEGDISGDFACTCYATMTLESKDGKDGKYTICGRWFLESGGFLDGFGEGQTTNKGGPKWDVAGHAQMSNGASLVVQGEIDFAKRAFVGKMFERI